MRREWRRAAPGHGARASASALQMQHADQREEPPRRIEVELDLAREPLLQKLRTLVMKRTPAHVEAFDLRGRSLADGLVVALADNEVVLDHAAKGRERQHHLA